MSQVRLPMGATERRREEVSELSVHALGRAEARAERGAGMSKILKELTVGDVVKLETGTARITSARRATWIRHVDGPAIDVQWEVISGPHKGEKGYYVGGASEEVNTA